MNWNIVDENWQQFKRRLKDLWGKLTVKIATHPSVANKTVDIYSVSSSGAKHLIGSVTTGSNGKASTTLSLTKGKTYKVVVRVAGLSSSKYISKYSSAHSKTVKS